MIVKLIFLKQVDDNENLNTDEFEQTNDENSETDLITISFYGTLKYITYNLRYTLGTRCSHQIKGKIS